VLGEAVKWKWKQSLEANDLSLLAFILIFRVLAVLWQLFTVFFHK